MTWCNVTWYKEMWCDVMCWMLVDRQQISEDRHLNKHRGCSTLQYNSIHNTMQYNTIQCNTVHYTTHHYTTLHYTTLHCTTLRYTPQHYTTPHNIPSGCEVSSSQSWPQPTFMITTSYDIFQFTCVDGRAPKYLISILITHTQLNSLFYCCVYLVVSRVLQHKCVLNHAPYS